MTITPLVAGDEWAVAGLVTSAFGQPDEARLVERLRATGRITLELVARGESGPIGHVAFSRLGIGEADGAGLWWALAPLAVAPEHQRQGIGTELVRAALGVAWSRDARLVVVLGDPAYYGRFGFRPAGELGLICPYPAPPECFKAIARGPAPPAGTVRYAPEFAAL